MENAIFQYDNNPSKLLEGSSGIFKFKRPQDIMKRYQDLAILPNIIGDREYLSRKATFDIFLKKTDSEFMNLHIKIGKTETLLWKTKNVFSQFTIVIFIIDQGNAIDPGIQLKRDNYCAVSYYALLFNNNRLKGLIFFITLAVFKYTEDNFSLP